MRQELYDHSPIVDRAPLSFPGGSRLAFYVGLNIESFRPDLPIGTPGGPVPDPLAYGWRDYGNRVGIWRLMDVFDEVGIPVTGIVNSDVCTGFPEIIEAGVARRWAWAAHGQSNSTRADRRRLRAGRDRSRRVRCRSPGQRAGPTSSRRSERSGTGSQLGRLRFSYTAS